MKKRLHLIIFGRVQGVFFRFSTRKRAQALDIKGWIRNNPEGTVEAVFEGEENDLQKILEFCQKGPILAAVKKVSLDWSKPREEFTEFKIKC